MTLYPSPAFLAINHVLSQEPWALLQLQNHANKIAHINLELLVIRLQISPAGLFQSPPNEAPADVTIHINLADVPLILQDKERAISYIKIQGDASLAQTFSEISKNLPFDFEHYLSQLMGNSSAGQIAAMRVTQTSKAVLSHLKSNAQKFQENVAEYFLEENPMLIRPGKVNEFAQEVSKVRDDVERLMKRIEKLEKAQNNVG